MLHSFCAGSAAVLGGTQSFMARGELQRDNFVENFQYCGNKQARTPALPEMICGTCTFRLLELPSPDIILGL